MSQHPVYASTAGIAHYFRTLPELLEALTRQGIDCIELGHSPSLAGLELPQGLSHFKARFLLHNYFPAPEKPFVLNLASQDAATLHRSRELCVQAIQLSAVLGAPFYSVHCGFLAEFDSASLGRKLAFADLCDYERGYATFTESLTLLLARARATGLRLLVEPNVVAPINLIDGRNSLLMMAEPRELARLLADFRDGALGVLLDLGHLKVTAATLGFGIAEFIDTVAPGVGAFHLHDNNGLADQHIPIQPGNWTLDVLCQPRFAGRPVVVEAKFNDTGQLVEHCIWLKNLFNR
jgi:sugar phosphate isomerase/epimerase